MSHLQGRGQCRTCHIRHLSIFARLPEMRFDQIQGFHPAVLGFRPDEILYHQGDTAQHAYTLRKGIVKLTKMLPNGRIQIVRVLQEGDLFGFEGFADQPYNQTAVALTATEVCRLPLNELNELKRQHIEIEQAMTNRWLQHLREAEDMMLELGAKKAGERLASFLMRWCSHAVAPNGWVDLPLSRAEMGELLGLTIETVSRFLSDWKRQGVIGEQRGMIQIHDQNGLRELACSSGSC